MGASENAALVRGIYQAFNDKELERLDAFCEPGATMTSEPLRATLDLQDFMANWAEGFPDGQIEVVNLMAGEHFAVAEIVGRGTHMGDMRTPRGRIQATRKPVELRMCELFRMRGGLVYEVRGYFDGASFLAQIGGGALRQQAATESYESFQPQL